MTFSKQTYKDLASLLGQTLLFFVSIQLLGLSVQHLGSDIISTINIATANPFIGLFIGLLATAIMQSSSTTTSLVVATVASGSIGLSNAIPIVMGANIGTTLTSTIVSMSYITKTGEFKKALSAGVCHDIFNILVAIILLPLEYKYGFMTYLSEQLTHFITGGREIDTKMPAFLSISLFNNWLSSFVELVGPIISVIVSVVLLFSSVKLISSGLYKRLIGDTQERISNVFSSTFKAFGAGILFTAIIQSSSLTTSLIVPLVATNKLKLSRAFQFIVGANLGTTLTALLAATFRSEPAISLALAHLLFNAIGALIFIGIPGASAIPIFIAQKLGWLTLKYRIAGLIYILLIFFLLPFTLIYLSR